MAQIFIYRKDDLLCYCSMSKDLQSNVRAFVTLRHGLEVHHTRKFNALRFQGVNWKIYSLQARIQVTQHPKIESSTCRNSTKLDFDNVMKRLAQKHKFKGKIKKQSYLIHLLRAISSQKTI